MTLTSEYAELFESPWGQLLITATSQQLCSIVFSRAQPVLVRPNDLTKQCCLQLSEYMAGKRQDFDLPLYMNGSEFQCQVWQQLQQIPYGTTCSYAELARAISRPNAVRAVGAANGRNRFTIVVPCHRVIGADGSLTGYAWGTEIKSALLAHERQYLA